MAQAVTRARDSTATSYDGFISYSHAADDLLAPRLQSALQRFAKPWWKRRAVRIFRDESSLSANPHLWSSITEALDTSGWFVLLLSPDAAQSEWVNQEIAYWVENRDPKKILPVVTDGTFGWTDGGVTGDAVPSALEGAFTEEPRWVDVRWAKDEDQLDLKDPRFADAVADIASTIRGIPKDDLASEEVRQHRRTVRTAWAAGGLVTVLAVAAVGFGIQSARNAVEAERQAMIAEQSAAAEAIARTEADDNARLAQENATEANRQQEAAERDAAIARSRELSASAVSVLDDDPELSIMLAIESIEATPGGANPSPEAVRTLREAVLANRLQGRLVGTGPYARISPDGSTLLHSDADTNTIVALDIETSQERWRSVPIETGTVGRVEISPDGGTVTVQVHHPDYHEVVVVDASSGTIRTTLGPSEGCLGYDPEGLGFSAIGGFSPGGEWFSVFTGRAGCGAESGEGWVAVYDTADWEERHRLNTEDGTAFAAAFSSDADRVLISSWTGQVAELRSFPDLDLIASHPNAWSYAALSPDGERIAFLRGDRGPVLADAETGDIIKSLSHADEAFFYVEPFAFSPDGSRLVAGTAARDLVFDGTDGGYLGDLGSVGPTGSLSFTADGSLLVTATHDGSLMWGFGTGQPISGPGTGLAGALEIFDAETGLPLEPDGFSGDWVNPDQAGEGPNIAVTVIDFDSGPVLAVLDPGTGAVSAWHPGWGTQLADGRFVLVPRTADSVSEVVGPLEVWDPLSGTSTVLAGCPIAFPLNPAAERPDLGCADGGPFFGGVVLGGLFPAVADHQGSAFAALSLDASSRLFVWDPVTLTPISEFAIPTGQVLVGMNDSWIVGRASDTPGQRFTGEHLYIYDFGGQVVGEISAESGAQFFGAVLFNDSGTLMFARDAAGRVSVYRTSTWERIVSWQADDARIRGWSLSPTGDRLATAGEAGSVHVWDLDSVDEGVAPSAPSLTIPVGLRASDVVWESEDRLVIFMIDLGTGARWHRAYLDTDDLVANARSQLTREFTEAECSTYAISACPVDS